MAEELRLFVRTALFAALIAVIYWFVSYDVVGTILLGALAVGGALFVVTFGQPRLSGGLAGVLGFADTSENALDVDEEEPPTASVWPVLAATATLLLGFGLVYGAWFWGPGLVLGAACIRGWSR